MNKYKPPEERSEGIQDLVRRGAGAPTDVPSFRDTPTEGPSNIFTAPGGAPPPITSRMISDPTLRGVIRENMERSASRGEFVSPSYASQMEEERAATLRRITSYGEAARLRDIPEIEKGMQRRGVVSSGETTRRELEKTEEVRLQEMGLLAESEEKILSRFGGYREAERGRQLQERLGSEGYLTQAAIAEAEITGRYGVAGVGAEAGVEQALISAGAQVTTATLSTQASRDVAIIAGKYGITQTEIGANSAEVIAQINSSTSMQIADIQRDTTLSAKEKDIQIANIQANAMTDVADIRGKYSVQTANIGAEASKYTADRSYAASVAVAEANNEWKRDVTTIETMSRESIANVQADTALSIQDKKEQIALIEDHRIRSLTVSGWEKDKEMLKTSITGEQDLAKIRGQQDRFTEFVERQTAENIENIRKSTALSAKDKDKAIMLLQTKSNETITNANNIAQGERLFAQINSAKDISKLESLSRESISNSQNQTRLDVTAVEADTTLSAMDKQIRIARIQRDGDIKIAQGHDAMSYQTALIGMQSATNVANIRTTSNETIASLQASASETIANIQKDTSLGVADRNRLSAEHQASVDQRIASLQTQSAKEIVRIQGKLDLELKDMDGEMLATTITGNITLANMSNRGERKRLILGIKSAQEEGRLTREATKELQTELVKEEARQFDVTDHQDFIDFTLQLNETMREFDISVDEQRWYAEQSIEVKREELTQLGLYDNAKTIIDVFNLPEVEVLKPEEKKALILGLTNRLLSVEEEETLPDINTLFNELSSLEGE